MHHSDIEKDEERKEVTSESKKTAWSSHKKEAKTTPPADHPGGESDPSATQPKPHDPQPTPEQEQDETSKEHQAPSSTHHDESRTHEPLEQSKKQADQKHPEA